jgi:hypothetical protein
VEATRPPAPAPSTDASNADADLLFADETIDAASGWRQLNVHNAAFDLENGELASTYARKGSWAYAVRQLDAPETVVSVGGDFTSSGLGYFGWLCGDSSTGRYYGAVPETDGSLVFIDGGYAGVEPLERYDNLGTPIGNGATTTFGLDCVIDHGTLWMEAFVDDGQPIAIHEAQDVTDVTRFDVLGMYGESLDPPFTTSVTNIVARATHDGTGSVSFAALPLANYAQPAGSNTATTEISCLDAPAPEGTAAAVNCYLQDEGQGPEMLRLASYTDAASMQKVYAQNQADACPAAPAPTLWSRGSVRCVTQRVGIDLEWTDSSINVIGQLVDLDGDYGSTEPVWSQIVSSN